MNYPFDHHPCWSNDRSGLWARIHLPVAPKCNVKCFFCDHNRGASCHIPRPGRASRTMTVRKAIDILEQHLHKRNDLRIVAVAGPGEPLANPEFFEVFEYVHDNHPDLKLCVSTNGTLLKDSALELARLGVSTVTVSVHTLNPETAQQVYEWAILDGSLVSGPEMGKQIVDLQVLGIQAAVSNGLMIKANTILIPGMNDHEIDTLSRRIADLKVSIQNITPLIPISKDSPPRPTHDELVRARLTASANIPQFTQCKQCRSDVVGVPGHDTIL